MQIDLVVERMDGEVHLCECKWEKNPVGLTAYNELIRKASLYPDDGKTINPTIFSLSKPTRELEDLKKASKLWFYTLKDIYEE